MRVLNLLGVHIGSEEELIAPGPGNPTGYWERSDIFGLNRKILSAMGGRPVAPPDLPPGWEASDALAAERERGRRLVSETFGESDLFGWKCPTASLTLPFWQQLIPDMRYVICLRNPLDASTSLSKLFPDAEHPLALWLRYMASTLVNTAGAPRLFVSYEDYLDDWRVVAARLARFVGRDPAILEGEAGERIGDLVDRQLRHHSASLEELLGDERVPTEISSLYLMVNLLAVSERETGVDRAGLVAGVDAYARRLLEPSRPGVYPYSAESEPNRGAVVSKGERWERNWSDASAWVGDGLRREAFFFRSRGVELYGSLYAAAEPSRSIGLVACGSWGVEADRTEPLMRSVALAMARLGGAALVFHYPGYGDSYGDLAGVDLADMSEAAIDAAEEAARRHPGVAWSLLAGFMLGASVACLARRRVAADSLLLVQPALRPSSYFQRLSKSRQPLSPGSAPRSRDMVEANTAPKMAYGYPIPGRVVERGEEADGPVAAALAEFDGDGAVIRHAKPPESDPVPERFERVEVPGTWRFGSQNHPRLASATADWLDRRTRDGQR